MAHHSTERLLAEWAGANPALGSRCHWPEAFRVLATLMMHSSRPMFLAWGPELHLVYNDAYIAILGDRHPSAFGRPLSAVWPDAWPAVQPIVARVQAGVPVDADEFPVLLERDGRAFEAHFSFSFCPVMDEGGARVGGLFCTVAEITDAVRSRRVQSEDLRRRLALFEKAPGFICVLRGPDHVFEFVNDGYEEMMGKGKVLGRSAREVFPEGREQGLFELLDRVYATGERFVAQAMPIRFAPSDRQPEREALFDFVWEPLNDDDGRVSGVFAIGYDVTPVARSRQTILAAERRYRELLEAMGEGFVVLDEDFRLVEINAEGERLDGRPRDELLGRTHWELWPAANGTALEAAYRRVMRERRAEDLRHHYVSEDHDLWMHVRIYPVSGGIASLYRDVTQIVRAEDALRLGHERFRAAIEAIGVLWTNDADGRMVGPQPGWERLTGQRFDEYQGYGWSRAVHPEDVEPTIRAWHAAVEACSTFVFEHRARRVDGQWRRFSIRAVPVLNPDRTVREWVGVHIDVTDAAAAFEALRQADRKKDEFIATLAHELRNPLAPIRTAAHVLSRHNLQPDKLAWCSDLINRQVHAMAVLLDDLLDVARITTGRLELRRRTVEVREVVGTALETVRPLVDAKRHALEVRVDDALPGLDGDPIRIVQILSNLLTNAAKYTDPGGRIELAARAVEDRIVFEVCDNGIGIAPEVLPTIFEMFRQVEDRLDRSEGGLGIGLALTRGLVLLHGGSIEGRSEGLGAGACFRVTLPAARPMDDRRRADADPVSSGTALPACGVLVVDDNQDAAHSLSLLLESEGFRVRVAHDGEGALRACEAHRPDAALLDLGLPGMSGYELARRIRASPGGGGMLLAVISGWGRDDDRRRASVAGFDHHFTKPVDPAEVVRWLRAHAAGTLAPSTDRSAG